MVLALLGAVVVLGVSVYIYVQVTQRADRQGQLTNVEEVLEQARQEMADALKRLEEQIRGGESREAPARP